MEEEAIVMHRQSLHYDSLLLAAAMMEEERDVNGTPRYGSRFSLP
jgi:hypothetical protein